MDDATGTPVARAAVILRPWAGTARRLTATTDGSGRFSFPSVPVGRYELIAAKRGLYIPTSYGQRGPTLPGQPLTLGEDDRREVVIRMVRSAVIAGRILDEDGQPAADVVVSAYSKILRRRSWGRLQLAPQYITATNDLGEFRLFDMAPGEYRLVATPRHERGEQQLLGTYYPGTFELASASPLTLAPGQLLLGIEFIAQRQPAPSIEGTVHTPDGRAVPRGAVALELPGRTGVDAVAGVGSILNGRFAVNNVVPGEYVLRARYSPIGDPPDAALGADDLSGSVRVGVGPDDMQGVVIVVTRGSSIGGRVVVESPSSAQGPEVAIEVESGEVGRRLTARPASDGTFRIDGVESGTRRVAAALPSGWFLRRVELNGADVTEAGIDVREHDDIQDVVVVVTNVPNRLAITIDAKGDTDTPLDLIAFPADASLWRADSPRIRIRAGMTGREAVFEHLPAGDYLAAAVRGGLVDADDPRLPAVLSTLVDDATPVRIVEGQTTAVSVSVR